MSHACGPINQGNLTLQEGEKVLEVSNQLEKQWMKAEKDPIKEASQQTSWSFDLYLSEERWLAWYPINSFWIKNKYLPYYLNPSKTLLSKNNWFIYLVYKIEKFRNLSKLTGNNIMYFQSHNILTFISRKTNSFYPNIENISSIN